jgi:hypothetical protein
MKAACYSMCTGQLATPDVGAGCRSRQAAWTDCGESICLENLGKKSARFSEGQIFPCDLCVPVSSVVKIFLTTENTERQGFTEKSSLPKSEAKVDGTLRASWLFYQLKTVGIYVICTGPGNCYLGFILYDEIPLRMYYLLCRKSHPISPFIARS